MKFNINGLVRVRLTPHGRIHLEKIDRDRRLPAGFGYANVEEDAAGWSEWYLWELMDVFGPVIGLGLQAPFETEIEIIEVRP